MHLSPQQRAALLNEARAVIRRHLSGGGDAAAAARDSARDPAQDPAPAPDTALSQPAGCFVSLHELRSHRLRGCVGRLEATAALWETLRAVAGNVLQDPRFADHRVTPRELPELEIEISVLSPLRPAPGPLDFDPATDGLYLTCGQRAGCFLPQVARETGWGREHLLDRLCAEKMGLPPGTWRDPRSKLFLFTTLMIGPEPFVLPASKIEEGSATVGGASRLS
jgi:AmmeMemoRadiSam system protein A